MWIFLGIQWIHCLLTTPPGRDHFPLSKIIQPLWKTLNHFVHLPWRRCRSLSEPALSTQNPLVQGDFFQFCTKNFLQSPGCPQIVLELFHPGNTSQISLNVWVAQEKVLSWRRFTVFLKRVPKQVYRTCFTGPGKQALPLSHSWMARTPPPQSWPMQPLNTFTGSRLSILESWWHWRCIPSRTVSACFDQVSMVVVQKLWQR